MTKWSKFISNDKVIFCGTTDIPGDVSSGFSKPEWANLFTLGGGIYVTHSLRFTSAATPASWQPAWPPSQYLPCAHDQALVGSQTGDLLSHMQMLYQLTYAVSAFCFDFRSVHILYFI